MLQLIIAILLGLASPSYNGQTVNSTNDTTITNCGEEDPGNTNNTGADGTGGQTSQTPPKP
ncbi:hypothetical protein [Pedobacter montanisoli]|uniref:Uncharacterized protein n=1 Tax=Pedobacter montanisoli TaxID=2923277 RepID=A0ABT0A011_9SPHI|nr:hypothetical protein [Pedobacter montanisoli]MCJ0743881.1 hypothetical protein [Pedobacter montanisoli]